MQNSRDRKAARAKAPVGKSSADKGISAEAKSSSDNVSDAAGGDVSKAPGEAALTKSHEEAEEKSSFGRVPAEAKSSSDNVSEDARGDDSEAPGEAARAKAPVGKSSADKGIPAEAKSSSDSVSDAAGGDDSKAPGEASRTKSHEEAEGKSSFGRVTAESKSSSDNVSEDASRDEEAEVMKSQQERSLVEDTFTRSSVIDENERRIYEVDEKPEDRPRRQSKMPGKYSDFVMNSVKNRRIKSEVARSLSRVMPLNGKKSLLK